MDLAMRALRSAWTAVVASVLLRWVFCFLLFPLLHAGHSTVGKTYYFDSYREIAASVMTGSGYRLASGVPAIHRPPGYVAFVLLTNPRDPAHAYLVLHFLQGLLGGLAVWLTYRAARAWGLGRTGGLFAAWIIALWPFAIWETKVTVPENLLIALVPGTFLMAARVGASPGRAAAVGLAAAASALTHGLYQVFVVPAGLAVARFSPRGRRVQLAAITALAFLIPLSLWVVRNGHHGYRGVSAGLGLHYFKGNYNFDALVGGRPYFRDTDVAATAWVDDLLARHGLPPIETDEQRSDPRVNRFLDQEAVRDMLARPGHTLAKTLATTPLAWVHQQTAARSLATAVLLLPFVFLACRGLWRRPPLWPLALGIAIPNLAIAAIFVEAIPMRYALPWMPLLAILASAGVEPLDQASREPRARTLGSP